MQEAYLKPIKNMMIVKTIRKGLKIKKNLSNIFIEMILSSFLNEIFYLFRILKKKMSFFLIIITINFKLNYINVTN